MKKTAIIIRAIAALTMAVSGKVVRRSFNI